MSLRYALLGLLADEPASGYDLTRVFELSLGSFAWSAKHSQIYPELNKLLADGLVRVVEEGARGRRTYDVTAAGRTALQAWLTDMPENGGVIRNEYLLRLFLLTDLPAADALALLDGYSRTGETVAGELGELRAKHEGPAVLEFGILAAEFGRRYFAMQHEWAEWAKEQVRTYGDPDGDRIGRPSSE